MIGFQDIMIKQNVKTKELAKQIGLKTGTVSNWFNNKVPSKYLKTLSNIFQVDENYLNKHVNDISTYSPRDKGFNKYNIIDNETTEIYVTRRNGVGVTFQIDTEELDKLIDLNYSWGAVWDEGVANYYAVSTHYYRDENGERQQESVLLTEVIMDYKPIDHIDHDTKNNRKYNLRKTEHSPNARNRRGKNVNNKSGHRNVSMRDDKWWVVQLIVDGKNTVLKKFPLNQLDEAALYAEEMRQKYYGKWAGKG